MEQQRQDRIESVRIMVEYNWMYLHHLYQAASTRLGEAGLKAVAAGIRRHGHYRGESIRSSAQGCSQPRDAFALMRAWDTAELGLASQDERLDLRGNGAEATLHVAHVPGSDYFLDKDTEPVLELYWREMLAGLAPGYDENLSITYEPLAGRGTAPWVITLSFSGRGGQVSDIELEDTFLHPVASVLMSRRTAGVFSGLCMHTTKALIERFGGTGEAVARRALYQFGAERATGMREQAKREGKALDFNSWFDIISKRDPNSAAWVFRGDTHISAGVFQVTCTYCPMADMWAEEGSEGLALGYIYDMEVHRGLVEAFNPNGVVAWDKVKTRGDRVCNFRFSIPDLVTDEDPPWARGLGNN